MVALPGTGLIVPIGPDPALRIMRGQCVGPAITEQAEIGIARFALHQRVVGHCRGRPDIAVMRNHVVVTQNDRRNFFRCNLGHSGPQPLHPAQFVVKLRARLGIAIGQIDAGDAGAEHLRLKIARMLVLWLARQAALNFDRGGSISQNRDAVEPFLAVPQRVVTELEELIDGKAFVLGLDFLQTGNRRTRLLQPFEQPRQPRLDPVDIETGDLHDFSCPMLLSQPLVQHRPEPLGE